MINIKKFVCNSLQENCYIVSDETNDAVVIDCGALYNDERNAITRYIDEQKLHVCHVICTHAHFDHCFGLATIWRHCNVKPTLPLLDKPFADIDNQMQLMLGTHYNEEQAPIDTFFSDGDTFHFGTHQFTAIATPGHSPGSSCLYCAEENVLFSGDTLFRMSIGRTDLQGGNWSDMKQSLIKLASMPPETKVMPGHGPATTIADEKMYNPYLRG